MINKISRQIDNINRSLEWLKKNRKEEYNHRFLRLIEERRKLRALYRAEKERPAIASFGESQKGKSYLIGNLLQKNGDAFTVLDAGKEINFVDSINPIGDKKEATGVVTRFTSFNDPNQADRYSERFPVIVKLFSVGNLATIFCDAYFSDVSNYKTYTEGEIREFSNRIIQKYSSLPEQTSTALVEDDILDIKAYLLHNVNAAAQTICRFDYFESLARIIRRVPVDEWVDVLQYLWHENQVITKMFRRLVNAFKTLRFSSEVYVPIEAVLHHGDNKNTIMSVDCLNGLDDPNWDKLTDVYLKNADGSFEKVADFQKCELCALCAETVFKIEKEFLEQKSSYFVDRENADAPGVMPMSTFNTLPPEVTKDLLKDTDLLDFPGARSRLQIQEEFLDNMEDKDGASNRVQILLRGKVAFLFNNYNEARLINILLFCHDNENNAVSSMYILIQDWINKYVGDTPEKRERTIRNLGGMSPLFLIGTKFNIDMIEKKSAEHNSFLALNQRWEGRFMKILYTQSFKAESVDWFNNWTRQGSTFKNTYMLRDFKYSGCNGQGNNLYEGYDETIKGSKENKLRLSEDFYRNLKRSFTENEHVAKFFENPELAWEVAATRNNDGSLYVIQNLAIAAKNAKRTRDTQFSESVDEIADAVHSMMKVYYTPDSIDDKLDENIDKAMDIARELDFTCNEDNYYFGHLLESLHVKEPEVLKIVHQYLLSPEMGEEVNDWKDYEIIRKKCDNFAGCYNDDDKWEVLLKKYRFRNREKAEEYLSAKGIDINTLFNNSMEKKTNSRLLAEKVFTNWYDRLKSDSLLNEVTADTEFSTSVMANLLDNIAEVAEVSDLKKKVVTLIAPYVDVLNLNAVNETFVADVISSTFCNFINDMGYSYIPEEKMAKIREIVDENSLDAFEYIDKEKKSAYTPEELTDLFNEINDSESAMTVSFENNYYTWTGYMIISFIAFLKLPEMSADQRRENEKLSQLLQEILN